MTTDRAPSSAARARTVYVIWLAMAVSVLVYAGLAYFLEHGHVSLQRENRLPALEGASDLIALALAAAGLTLSWFIGSNVGPPSEAGSAGQTGAEPAPSSDGWARIQTATVVMSAIAESVAIFGLLFFFMGLPFARFLRFVVLSLIIYGVILFRLQGWIAAEQRRG